VNAGDEVWTPAGWAEVAWGGRVKVAGQLIRVTLATGEALTMTPEHKVFTTRGVVAADKLRYDDCIVNSKDAACLRLENANKIGYRAVFSESFGATGFGFGKSGVFTLVRKAASSAYCTAKRLVTVFQRLSPQTAIGTTLAGETGFFAFATRAESSKVFIRGKSLTESNIIGTRTADIICGGIRSLRACTGQSGRTPTARYRTGITYTTKTGTNLTTGLKTSKPYQPRIILGFMAKQIRGLAAMPIRVNLLKSGTKQRIGINRQKERRGTEKTAKQLGWIASRFQSFAASAARNIKRITQPAPNFAAGVVKLERFESDEPVYDLTVPHHHCYYANGMLVSNSDSFRYMATGNTRANSKSGPVRRNLQGIA
jgi:hypothetical protein